MAPCTLDFSFFKGGRSLVLSNSALHSCASVAENQTVCVAHWIKTFDLVLPCKMYPLALGSSIMSNLNVMQTDTFSVCWVIWMFRHSDFTLMLDLMDC